MMIHLQSATAHCVEQRSRMHEDECEQLSFTPLDHHKVTHTHRTTSHKKYILHLTIQKEQAVIKLLADTTIKYR